MYIVVICYMYYFRVSWSMWLSLFKGSCKESMFILL